MVDTFTVKGIKLENHKFYWIKQSPRSDWQPAAFYGREFYVCGVEESIPATTVAEIGNEIIHDHTVDAVA